MSTKGGQSTGMFKQTCSLGRCFGRRVGWPVALLGSVAFASPVAAQEAGVAFHVGSLGLGADVAVGVHRNVGLRVGGNLFPFNIDITSSDVAYTVDLPSPTFLAVVDLTPGGGFRVSAGVVIAPDDFAIDAQLAEPVDIGGTLYTPQELGTLIGTFDTRDVAPYIGIGFGTPGSGRVSFFADLGVAFHGTPQVSALVSGPIALVPAFQQDLQREIQEIQDDVDPFKVYPVLSLGVLIGLGR